MKNIYTLILAFLLCATSIAQSLDEFTYQAVVRDILDVPIVEIGIGMQVSILKGSEVGLPEYIETFTPTTNANGLVSVIIGTGTPVSGSMATIDWGADSYWLKTEIDPTGGTSYSITGTSKLVSVPYSLYSSRVNIGNTLDEAYDDEDAVGSTPRVIEADEGEIKIEATSNMGLRIDGDPGFNALQLNGGGTADILKINQTGTGDGLEIENDGLGTGFRVWVKNAANATNAMYLRNQGLGMGLRIWNQNAANPDNTLFIKNDGLGKGIRLQQQNAASVATSLYVDNDGLGRAMELNNLNPANATNVMRVRSGGTADMVFIDNAGTGRGLRVTSGNPANAAEGVRINHIGTGDGLFLNNGGFGKGLVALQGNPTVVEPAIGATTFGLGPVGAFTTDDVNANVEPTVLSINNGAGSAGLFITADEAAGKVNFEPTVRVVSDGRGMGVDVNIVNGLIGGDGNDLPALRANHDGFGSAGLFLTPNTSNFSPSVEIINSGLSNGLHIDMFGSGDDFVGAAIRVEQGNTSSFGTAGRIAEFELSDAGSLSDSGVFISSSATFDGHSALRVIPASVDELAGVFEGDVEIAGDLLVGASITGVTTTTTDLFVDDTAIIGAMAVDAATIVDLIVTGSIVAPAKAFKIDHPLDPQNKYLIHNSIESNERINIYAGNIITDPNGLAVIQLPDYMNALNKDFKYQLTIVDKTFAQAIIWEPIDDKNSFTIKTNAPGIKVSWQVTGTRQDTWAKDNPLQTEVFKESH